MIVRAIAVVSLIVFVLLAGILPAVLGPAYYAKLLREEHAKNVVAWDPVHAWRVLGDTLAHPVSFPDMKMPAFAQPKPGEAKPAEAMEKSKSAAQIDKVFGKLLGGAGKNETKAGMEKPQAMGADYVRALEMMLTLGGYRAAMMLYSMPLMFVFGIAAVNDGMAERKVWARSFVLHDPELFAVSWVTALMLGCIAAITVFMPFALAPWLLPSLPLGMALLLNRAIANYRM